MIVHTTSHYLIIVMLLLLYTQVFHSVQFLALCCSLCILRHCLPYSIHTLSYTIHLPMTYNYRCLLPLTKYPSYFTLCSLVLVMSRLRQLRKCINVMTTRQNSSLSPLKVLGISVAYHLESLSTMLKSLSNSV